MLLLEERIAGPLPQQRLAGALAGIREVLPLSDRAEVIRYDVKGSFSHAHEQVLKHLKTTSRRRILVAGLNDPSALGALKAFEDAGRLHHCAIARQNAVPEACEELRRPDSRFIGTVAYFPERYGEELIRLALLLAVKETVPAANFIRHLLVTAKNVDHVYPAAQGVRAASA